MNNKLCFVILFIQLISFQQHENKLVKAANDGFVKVKGVQFMLNGSPYYAHGFNAYWLMYMGSNPSTRNKVTSAFQQASNNGLTMARTWAYRDGGDSPLQYSPGSYNEQMFQGLDFVIAEAKKYGIKLVLGLVNNYEDFGGKKQYVEWAKSKGQAISSEDEFFTNSVVKGFYKDHIETILTRRNTVTGVIYKDDPTIMAWELMNEPRCTSDLSGRTIQAWVTEMGSYLKFIDANHLLEIGLEGFYGKSSPHYDARFQIGTDFIANNQIPSVDFATVHSYPDIWLPGSTHQTQLSFLSTWISSHIEDSEKVLKKPILFAEFGKSYKDSGYSVQQRDAVYSMFYSMIYNSASRGGGAVGSMFWQLLVEGMQNYGDGYEVVFSWNPSTTNLISLESRKLGKIRKMYARLKNLEKWKRAKGIKRNRL